MLAPDERAVLLDALRPPPGAVLDAGVATTFTLDFAAALVPPLAFAAAELSETGGSIAALQCLRACSDRLDIFHQAGQIAVPARASGLLAFLEPMVHAVRRPRPGHLFHPKVWFLRYTDLDSAEPHFRLLCLTRNLTQDRSWDAVVRLDGTAALRPTAGNRPLSDLIRALPGLAVTPLPNARLERLEALAQDARRIEWEHPVDVDEIAFHLLGIPGSRSTFDFSGRRHLVISPFLTDTGLDRVAPESSDVTVISRPESFDQLQAATLKRLNRFVLTALPANDSAAIDTDAPEQSAAADPLPFGLHAKIIVVERGHQAYVHLGSANATDAAFDGNVEFVIVMNGSRSRLGIDALAGPDGPLRPFLEEYDCDGDAAPDPDDEEGRLLEGLLRDLAEVRFVVAVSEAQTAGNETTVTTSYDLAVTSRGPLRLPSGVRVTAELLTVPGDARPLPSSAALDVAFTNVQLADVTPFLALRLEAPSGLKAATVVRATILDDPAGRLDHVLARYVDTPEKFLRFLALLLGLEAGPLSGLDSAGTDGVGSEFSRFASGGGILEAVLRALADSPRLIVDLDRLVSSLGRTPEGQAVLPPGFADLWRTVMGAHARLAKEIVS